MDYKQQFLQENENKYILKKLLVKYIPNPSKSWAAELGLDGGCKETSDWLGSFGAKVEELGVELEASDPRLLVDEVADNSTAEAGLPFVLRFASFLRFISSSISASQETLTGGGWTHSLNKTHESYITQWICQTISLPSYVLLRFILCPDEAFKSWVCLRSPKVIRQIGLIYSSGPAITHLLQCLTKTTDVNMFSQINYSL